jgi:hypothetical protein
MWFNVNSELITVWLGRSSLTNNQRDSRLIKIEWMSIGYEKPQWILIEISELNES